MLLRCIITPAGWRVVHKLGTLAGTTRSPFFFTSTSQSKVSVPSFINRKALTAAIPFNVQLQLGEQLVNGDTFQLQTFNNKYACDLPMTQTPVVILQHFAVLSFIQDPRGRGVVCPDILSVVIIKEMFQHIVTLAWKHWIMNPVAAARH
ncbi:predicted protein [Lichtheimia corymbifera JMRC:FSU:9682]|uniref:Uncharacterized protein n=1 Tax=Lichtheimia corymbifera JMRC:FSU:9682 TaxID=1263082 RepID=A0A068RHC1_9FUNG|nr:predicted protein [Lichtheimia corymbifera JMRC:FSU:9682]